MPREKDSVHDGLFSLSGGMNSGISPSLLPDDQVSHSINTTFRRGFCRTRPKFGQFTLNFQGEEEAEDWFYSHPVTGWSYYAPPNGEQMLVFCVGGRFYKILPASKTAIVSEITPTSGRYNQNVNKTWFCQAAQYLIAQNDSDAAFIYDGTTSRRAVPSQNEVPTGRQMAYVNNRLFVVAQNGREILPGDLASFSSDSVLKFTEILLPAEEGGQPLSIPLEAGPITALIPTAQLDTQYGQGILLVPTLTSVCSINPIIQRSQWAQIQLQNIALLGNGFTSQWCAVVNGDVWGRAVDGWRSFIMARRDFNSWGNTPQSEEISRIIDKDSKNLLSNCSFVYFDNRLIGCVSPVSLTNGVYHRGMVALDFENISGLGDKKTPAYDGLWTGFQPYGLVTGEFTGRQRCFAMAYTPEGNQLWEISTEYGDDNDSVPIQCVVETKSFVLSSPLLWKSLNDCELWIDQLRGSVAFDIKYRPDQYPCWVDWKNFVECSKTNNCDETPENPFTCVTPKTYEAQYRPRIRLGMPPMQCVPVLKQPASIGYEFQMRLSWTGDVRLKAAILYANLKDVNPNTRC